MVHEYGKRERMVIVAFLKISVVIFVLSIMNVPSSVWAKGVKAYVDRNPVMVEETFRLIVEADGISSSETPDLRKLEDDFALLGTSHSQQMSMINGSTSSVTRWVTTLAPKRSGMLTIPALHVGNHASLPLSLTVQKPSQVQGAQTQRDIFLESEVDSHIPYVQGQVLLTLRLVSAVALQDGKLGDPEIEWGMVERVGKDATHETMRDGRRYQVTERRYIITPQKAGAQTIPPVLLSGSIPDERAGGSTLDQFFGNRRRNQNGGPFRSLFQTTRPVHIRSPKVSLTVKDMPADVKGSLWLPAKAFTIKESWSGSTDNIQMGEPLTRTLVMVAKGLRGEQLPELPKPDYGSIKTYPDKPQTNTEFDGTWVVGMREEKYAVVPTQPGSVTVPGIRIPWWNIDSARWETAELPSRTLTVFGDLPVKPDRPLDQRSTHLAPTIQSDDKIHADVPFDSLKPISLSFGSSTWPWIAGGLAGMWMLTLGGWWWDRRRRHSKNIGIGSNAEKVVESERKAIQAVKSACLEPSAAKTREALMSWASIKRQGKPCLSLGTAAQMLAEPVPDHADLKEAIWNLDRTLYTATAQHTWDGQRFWETIQPAMTAQPQKKKRNPETLPELYLH